MEAALQLSAPFCNKFYLSLTPIGGRLTFAEEHPDTDIPTPRGAVYLHIQDLLELKKLIERMLPENKIVQHSVQVISDGE